RPARPGGRSSAWRRCWTCSRTPWPCWRGSPPSTETYPGSRSRGNPRSLCLVIPRDGPAEGAQVDWVVKRTKPCPSRGWVEGATQPPGGPHAEAVALEAAGARARGATMYVTLEPCAHHGRTPPCADAIVAAGVSRVVVGIEDPDPQVAGRGLDVLRAAGV